MSTLVAAYAAVNLGFVLWLIVAGLVVRRRGGA